jgi:hypothetical protein
MMSRITAKSRSDAAISITETDIDEFRGSLRGSLVTSGDADYSEARSIWNGLVDRKPALIVRCSGTTDVVAAVKFARKHGLLFSLRSGGHHVAGKALCDGGLVIDLSAMNGVYVDPERRIARVQGGATLGDIDHETSLFNLAAPLGVVSKTGVAGLTLHGGLGWLSRKHGMSLDNLLSVDVVTAEGKVVKASNEQNQDLFWAVRGGGGNFGVVTSFEFKLHPVEEKVWLMLTLFPVEDGAKGLRFFREYMAKAPKELMAIALYWNAPTEEFIPEDVRGKPVFIMAGSYAGPLADGEKVIEPLRNFSKPLIDLTQTLPFENLQRFLDADYPDGRRYYWKSTYLNELSDEVIQVLSNAAKKRPSGMSSVDVWSLGEEISRVPADQTAFNMRKAPFLIGIEANWDDDSESNANVAWARGLYDNLMKIADTGAYLNFPGFVEEGEDMAVRAYGANYKRLKDIKSKYDPDNFFRGVLNISPNGKTK